MSNKEVEINGKTIGESTKVTITISTLIWVIGGLLFVISTLATIGYFDIKSDTKDYKAGLEKEKIEYMNEVKKILQEELRYERDKREKLSEDVGEIKGDIKVILEKTRNLEGGNNGHNNHSGFSVPDTSSAPGH